MSATKILDEAQKLNGVSNRLDALAEQYPVASEALLVIAGSIRDSAVLLEMLVATKISPPSALAIDQHITTMAGSASELVVQHDTKQRTMHLQATVVVNESKLPELVHEEIHSGAGGANHFRQSLLTYLWSYSFGRVFFSETGQY